MTVTLGKHSFKMSVVPANMQTIIDESIAEFLAENWLILYYARFDEAARIPLSKNEGKGLTLFDQCRCQRL